MATMSYWVFVVDVLFPIAFVLILLLNIPAPRKFRRGIVIMVDKVLSFPLLGSFQLLHIVMALTGASFAETSRQSYQLQQQRVSELVEAPNVVQGLLAKKWRAERNWWISSFCFTLWCLLAASYRMQVHVLDLEEKLYGPSGAPPRTGTAGAPAKKAAVPSAPEMEKEKAGAKKAA